jgi:hypothetical protein
MLSQGYQGPILYFLELFCVHSDAERSGDCGSGVFIADEVDGVGDKNYNGQCQDTLIKTSEFMTIFFNFPSSRISSISFQIEGILLYKD